MTQSDTENAALQRIFHNVGWLSFDRVLRLTLGVFVGVWVARYLGPDQFGVLSYALALVALASTVSEMGLRQVVVRGIVRDPIGAAAMLGTALVLRLLAGIFAYLLTIIAVSLVGPDDPVLKSIVYILGFGLIFRLVDVLGAWFESQVLSKYLVWVQNSVLVLVSGGQVYLILADADLVAFAWVGLLQAMLLSIGFVLLYICHKLTPKNLSVSKDLLLKMAKDSWPLMLSALSVMVYMRIDQVMLASMVGSKSAGIYSAAIKLSEVWYAIPTILAVTLFPAILESRKNDIGLYRRRMQRLMNLLVLISLSVSLVVTFLADPLIQILYGNGYSGAGVVLKIHIWASVFVFVGVAGNRWYLAEDLQNLILYRTLAGAGLNIILNLVLIPLYREIGAAISTLVSHAISAYFMDLSSKHSVRLFAMKSQAIFVYPLSLLSARPRD
jgi:PST family polysaccharide transporter